jgi:homogentisate 1,2-dioxygenase
MMELINYFKDRQLHETGIRFCALLLQLIRNMSTYPYFNGFGSYISSEALPDALPKAQNSPQVCPYGLYAEQLSGSAFTAPRAANKRSWLYRIRPSAKKSSPFKASALSFDLSAFVVEPAPLRWNPHDLETLQPGIDFLHVNIISIVS